MEIPGTPGDSGWAPFPRVCRGQDGLRSEGDPLIKKMLFLLPCLFFCWGTPLVGAETLEIPGTGACEVILKQLAAAFKAQSPGQQVLVPPSIGSRGGIRLVGTDQALMGRVSRPLKEEEKAYGLRYLVFARDAVIFAVGARVEIQSLTPNQIMDIYSGKITNWQEVGGNSGMIRVIIREPEDSILLVIQQHLQAFQTLTFSPNRKIAYRNSEMMEMLEKYKNAIGFITNSSLGGTKTSIRPVALDHIMPTPANLEAGKYQLVCDYALVFKENRLNEPARKFLDFIFSEAGKAILVKNGLIPTTRE